jgi:hypothetical protein
MGLRSNSAEGSNEEDLNWVELVKRLPRGRGLELGPKRVTRHRAIDVVEYRKLSASCTLWARPHQRRSRRAKMTKMRFRVQRYT